MALGNRREERQQEMWVATADLPRSEGHVFYKRLNRVLAEADFDKRVEELCRPYYHSSLGRPGIPPGVYFRMLMVGYFEGIGSQRGIAWRCHDSLSLREFLGVSLGQDTPDHSSLTRVRDRLPEEVHIEVFRLVLQIMDEKGLLAGKTVAVDATTLEANAAMKSIVRKDTGEDWEEYVARLMEEAGEIEPGEEPTAEEVRRFDKQRKNKKVSNEEWESATDPDSRVAKMKDGRTHLAYKAEHVIDLETGVILGAEVYHADQADTDTLCDSVMEAAVHLEEAGLEAEIEEVVADKGYHASHTIELAGDLNKRTYIPEPTARHQRRWTDKPEEYRRAVHNNRRRTRTEKNKRLQRLRSERVERSFAHVCETGGMRRQWLRGIEKVRKRYLIAAVTHNLGVLMRTLFNMGTPRGLQTEGESGETTSLTAFYTMRVIARLWRAFSRLKTPHAPSQARRALYRQKTGGYALAG